MIVQYDDSTKSKIDGMITMMLLMGYKVTFNPDLNEDSSHGYLKYCFKKSRHDSDSYCINFYIIQNEIITVYGYKKGYKFGGILREFTDRYTASEEIDIIIADFIDWVGEN